MDGLRAVSRGPAAVEKEYHIAHEASPPRLRKPNRVSDGDVPAPPRHAARGCPCPSPNARRRLRKPNRVSDGDVPATPRHSGLPVPVAERSLRPSRASLARCFLRFAILAARRKQRRLSGTGSSSLISCRACRACRACSRGRPAHGANPSDRPQDRHSTAHLLHSVLRYSSTAAFSSSVRTSGKS